MTLTEAVAILTAHNRWRRGLDETDDDLPSSRSTDPKLLGQALDAVAELVPRLISQSVALSQIASTSPVMRMKPNGIEERCLHCRALIDLAREALGHQPWPAAAGTAIEPTP